MLSSEGSEPGLERLEHGFAAGKANTVCSPGELSELIGSELGGERMSLIHTELHDERLHRRGVVDVGDFKPEGLALLDGCVDFGGAPGIIFLERVNGAEEINRGVRSLDDPDGGLGVGERGNKQRGYEEDK